MAKRRGWLWVAAAAALLATVGGIALRRMPATPLSPPAPGAVLVQASQGLDTVVIDAVFDPGAGTLSVYQEMALTNRTGAPQNRLVLRAYANAFRSEDVSPAAMEELYDRCYPDGFSQGWLAVREMTVQPAGGATQTAAYAYADEAQTVLAIPLPAVWAAGETLRLTARYTVYIPKVAYRFGQSGDQTALGNVFLIPSPFWGGEYRTQPYNPIGDPFISECRNYDVRLTLPDGYAAAGSAAPVTLLRANGTRTVRFSAPAVRDFALWLSRSASLAQAVQGGVLVQAYARTQSRARDMLAAALEALACYGERYGGYPYPAFTLCETDLPWEGDAYPSLSLLSSEALKAGGDSLAQLVARETAHQWWYATVGSDGFYQPWQDEALCEFSLLAFWEQRHGAAARAELAFARLETAMRVTIPQGVTPGSPVDYFGDTGEYRVVVAGRGGAAMLALDTAMGGGLDGFLQRYAQTYAFGLATRDDFETLLRSETGEDWSPLLSDYLDTYLNN